MLNRVVIVATILVTGCTSVPTGRSPEGDSAGASKPLVITTLEPAPRVGRAPSDSLGAKSQSPTAPAPAHDVPSKSAGIGLRQFIERNDDRLLQVYVGMGQMEVERIMAVAPDSVWKNPHRRERLQAGERFYDVWFYLTREPRAGRPIGEAELTPVILSNGKVVSLGRYPLKKLRRDTVSMR
jgi:hypothetical protein